MIRTFVEHDVRWEQSLDGRWAFVPGCDRKDKARLPKAYTRTIQVPSAWEQLPGLENYRGTSWLRTEIAAVEDAAVRLVFGGVSHTGTVFVDGREVGHHEDAFTPWDVVIPGLKPGMHELVVEVDNSFGPHAALHISNDYYSYGGITRPVMQQLVPAVYIDKVWATPRRERGGWGLEVQVRLRNWSETSQKRQLTCLLGAQELDLGQVTVKAGGQRIVKGMLSGLTVNEWSHEAPHLYELATLLLADGELEDDLVDRVGFREVTVKGRKIQLNGKPLRLRGYNRHEDHPQFGNALPLAAMVADLELLRHQGCNAVRTCHYPNDMRFLDLCDEMGFYVWEESHARTVDFAHPAFGRQIAQSTREMLEWHHNHPSIVMWGCLNECESETKAGRRVYRRVLKMLRDGDGSRPITFASNRGKNDICLDLVDIVSINRYDAWYGPGLDAIASGLEDMLKWLNTPASGAKGKPVIMSEFGAGAIYGVRQRQAAHWSEEYQCDVLDESLRVYLQHPAVAGAFIWQFCDCRVTTDNWAMRRPRTMNNKGIVDEYRRPKLAYAVVKQRMQAAAADKR